MADIFKIVKIAEIAINPENAQITKIA